MYVNPQFIPDGKNKYVCWIDIMGTQNKMSESIKTAATAIIRLHGTIIEDVKHYFSDSDIRVYPMMDGAYVTSNSQYDMLNLLKYVFIEMSREYICDSSKTEDKKNECRSFLRAAIAYGEIIEGNSLPRDVCASVANAVNTNFALTDLGPGSSKQDYRYKDSILFGRPMVLAYSDERKAPPFGIYIDESVRFTTSTDQNRIYSSWWKWYDDDYNGSGRKNTDWNEDYKKEFISAVKKYFKYAKEHKYEWNYGLERIKEHEDMFNEYFESFDA